MKKEILIVFAFLLFSFNYVAAADYTPQYFVELVPIMLDSHSLAGWNSDYAYLTNQSGTLTNLQLSCFADCSQNCPMMWGTQKITDVAAGKDGLYLAMSEFGISKNLVLKVDAVKYCAPKYRASTKTLGGSFLNEIDTISKIYVNENDEVFLAVSFNCTGIQGNLICPFTMYKYDKLADEWDAQYSTTSRNNQITVTAMGQTSDGRLLVGTSDGNILFENGTTLQNAKIYPNAYSADCGNTGKIGAFKITQFSKATINNTQYLLASTSSNSGNTKGCILRIKESELNATNEWKLDASSFSERVNDLVCTTDNITGLNNKWCHFTTSGNNTVTGSVKKPVLGARKSAEFYDYPSIINARSIAQVYYNNEYLVLELVGSLTFPSMCSNKIKVSSLDLPLIGAPQFGSAELCFSTNENPSYYVTLNKILTVPCTQSGDEDADGYKYFGCMGTGPYDCDDANYYISPGAPDVCANYVDDNCDGIVDNCNVEIYTPPVQQVGGYEDGDEIDLTARSAGNNSDPAHPYPSTEYLCNSPGITCKWFKLIGQNPQSQTGNELTNCKLSSKCTYQFSGNQNQTIKFEATNGSTGQIDSATITLQGSGASVSISCDPTGPFDPEEEITCTLNNHSCCDIHTQGCIPCTWYAKIEDNTNPLDCQENSCTFEFNDSQTNTIIVREGITQITSIDLEAKAQPGTYKGIKSISATDTTVAEAKTIVKIKFYESSPVYSTVNLNVKNKLTGQDAGTTTCQVSGNCQSGAEIVLSNLTPGTYEVTGEIGSCPAETRCSDKDLFTVKQNQEAVAIPEIPAFFVIFVALAVVFIIARKSRK